jgi:hypothetical protein
VTGLTDNKLFFHHFASGREKPVLERPRVQFGFGLSVSPDRKWVLWSENAEPRGSDLMSIENFR